MLKTAKGALTGVLVLQEPTRPPVLHPSERRLTQG
jgi:hypothetical protein